MKPQIPEMEIHLVEPIDQLRCAFARLESEIRPLDPIGDGYLSLSVSVSGFGGCKALDLHVFFGDGHSYDVGSVDELKAYLADKAPETIRAERIQKLESELAELRAKNKA